MLDSETIWSGGGLFVVTDVYLCQNVFTFSPFYSLLGDLTGLRPNNQHLINSLINVLHVKYMKAVLIIVG